MKQNQILSGLFLLAMTGATGAQTTTTATPSASKPTSSITKPATTTAKAATTTAKTVSSTTGHTATTATAGATKLPPGVPVVRGVVKPAFTLRYEDISIGTGADAVPNKLYKVTYTGYLGLNGREDDGRKFDSSFDHRAPLIGKDGKPEMGDDGKPKLGEPQPMTFPQGMGRLIPGFDQGFAGMKVGGKRRLFIPWQLAYGAAGRPGPDPAHPGIPPKADLIFDVELVDVADMPTPQRPMMPPPRPGTAAPQPGAPGQPGSGATGTRGVPAQPGATTAPATPSQPAPPPSPPTTAAPPNTSAPATPTTQPEPK